MVFHADELQAQQCAGVDNVRAAIRDFMPEQHREFFPLLPYLFVAVPDDAGWPLATVLARAPGFVTAPDPVTLHVAARPDADDPAAPFFRAGTAIGVIGLDLSTRRRNRANGAITAHDEDGFTIAVRESFGNCPQYIQRRTVTRNAASPQPVEMLDGLDAEARRLIAGADTFFVASRARSALGGGMDISHRGGRPGFVRIDGDTLTIPDFRGNRYFNTLGNLLGEPRASLLFVDFERGDVLQLQGVATILWDSGDAAQGADRLWQLRVMRGWRRRAALPLRWHFQDYSPVLAQRAVI